jgi:hypothetical protein
MRTDCPDCNLPLRPIHVIDRGNMEKPNKGLGYEVTGEKPKWLKGLLLDGTIEAMMCEECKRVLFSAVPAE